MFGTHKPPAQSEMQKAFQLFIYALWNKVEYVDERRDVHTKYERIYYKEIDKCYMEMLQHYSGQPGKPIGETMMTMAKCLFLIMYGRNLDA
jgi:hypothetical protein